MTLPAVGASVCASGNPGMKGKHRRLDRKGEGEGRKEPVLLMAGMLALARANTLKV